METRIAQANIQAPIVVNDAQGKVNATITVNEVTNKSNFNIAAATSNGYKTMKTTLNFDDKSILKYIKVKAIVGYNPSKLIVSV
jgi:hypothetical protein